MANNIYYNSQAKAKETKLLSLKDLMNLARAKSVEEISKLLIEKELLKGLSPKSFLDLFKITQREEKEFLTFLKTSTPEKDISNFFLLKYDYFNLESIYLSLKLGKKFELMPEGNLKISRIEEILKMKKYEFLSKEMQNALKFVDGLFEKEKQNGFLVDTAFKKALFLEKLEKSKVDKTLFDYMTSVVDLKNIELCFRFRNIEFFKNQKLDGGTLEDKFFEMLLKSDLDKILRDAKNSTYYSAIELIIMDLKEGKPFLKFEYLMNCFGESYFEKYKFRTDKNFGYLRYCFKKRNEIFNLKMIFEGLLGKLSYKKICDNLRRAYDK